MEQAEIPDVGGGPAPSAKVIDLSAMRSTPEKDAPPDIPKETEAPSVSVTEYSKREWEKPMPEPEPEKPKPKRGRPAKAEKATPNEPGAKKEVKAEKSRRGRPPKAEKASPEQAKPPKAGKTHAAPEEKAAPPAPEVLPTPRDATRAEKEEIVTQDRKSTRLLDLSSFSARVASRGVGGTSGAGGAAFSSGAAWVLPALGGLVCSGAVFSVLGGRPRRGFSAFTSFLAPGSVGVAFSAFAGRPRLGLGFSGSGMGFSHSRLLYSVTETDGASVRKGD